MSRAKILLVLAIVSGILMVQAAPAAATWVALNGSTEGIFTSEVSSWNLGNGKTVTCQEDAGKWSIRKADKEQIKVSKGGHLNLLFTTFASCTSNLTAEINEPIGGELQLAQRAGTPVKISAKYERETILESKSGCVIKIPATAENSELAKTTVTNQGKEQRAELQLSGIITNVNEACTNEGLKSSKEAQFKTTETAKGLTFIESNGCTSGSGSAIQTVPQQKFIGLDGTCITYNNPLDTESDQALEEWGMLTKELMPKDSANGIKLDGYIGTDNPPTMADLTNGKAASGTNPITMPVMAAPIAVVFHPPTSCTIKVATWKVPNQELDLLFRHQQTWTQFVEQIGGGTPVGTGCSEKATVEVRSDKSGTSLAFKEYLNQIKSSVWQSKFITDEDQWPEETMAKNVHFEGKFLLQNKGNKGEALAVLNTVNSIGYVNAADAHANGIKAWHNNQDKTFWGQVQNNGLEGETKIAEPVQPKGPPTAGNCPIGVYTFAPGAETEAKAKPPVWTGVKLANIKTSGTYPLCALTYDVAWENYSTATLEKAYGNHGEEVEGTVKAHLEFILGAGQGDIGKGIPEYYSPLPENLTTIAKEALKSVTP